VVEIVPWGPGDQPLLERLVGDPAMMEHLGGPETPQKIAERQGRYERPGSNQYKIVFEGEGVGWVGFWEREHRGETVYEMGWSVRPEFQGRGIAAAGTTLALDAARATGGPRYCHASPAVDNAPSNAICRKAGFELLGAYDDEYPPGTPRRLNDWRFDLRREAEGPPPGP
jgi:RimJ/RimL family protein N-acetyltransferase